MPLLKKEIISLLEQNAYDTLLKLSLADKKTISLLISLSYNKNDRIAWRAIEVIGLATGKIAASNPETVRNIAGRLLWMMRDESGGIGWSAPEILGEIVRNNPALCSDLAPIIASFHEEEMLCSGVLRALGRIGPLNSETVRYAAPIIRSYLNSTDETLRGYAAWASGEMGITESLNDLESIGSDGGHFRFYEEGEIRDRTVGETALAAVDKIKKGK